jgi:SET domain-containing protein
MLLVPVKVNRSSIHGIGIFASQAIEANTRIWCFTPGFDLALDPSALEQQPPHFRQTMLHYGYIDPRRHRFILCCDDYRFINHSDTPNVRVDLGKELYGVDFAARDIQAGEELTVDYGIVDGARP